MDFFLCFIPLFVAIDPIGILPSFIGLTQGLDRRALNRVVLQSVLTAIGVSLVFMTLGPPLLSYLGIEVGDFLIAGGALLFIISLRDMMSSRDPQVSRHPEDVGAVPIGVPLIAGPGLLTTTLVLAGQYGYLTTTAALLANLVLTAIFLFASRAITRVLGKNGAKTVGKIANLILAAIAVMLIRKGLVLVLAKTPQNFLFSY